ncbi:MAG: amidohydrolase family protein [Spirochaetia bacterium]
MNKLLENWRSGKGIPDIPVVDAHIHLKDWRRRGIYNSFKESLKVIPEYMETHGIDMIWALSGGGMFFGNDYIPGNTDLLKWRDAFPEKVVPFCHINPHDNPDRIFTELRRMFKNGVRGIKLLNRYQHDAPGDSEVLMKVYAFAEANGMMVINHFWTPAEFDRISSSFPDTVFIGAHVAPPDLLRSRENVYTSMWHYGSLGWLDRIVSEAPTRKIMLGSDAFGNPPSVGIGAVLHLDLPEDKIADILGGNALRLMKRFGILPGWIKARYPGADI